MLYFFYKIIIFSLNNKNIFSLNNRKTMYEARSVNSHNSERVDHNAHVIFVLHSAMKTHLLTNQNPRTIQVEYLEMSSA